MGTVEAEEAPAIAALGSLFKLTQVNLWVNASQETQSIDDTSNLLSGISSISSEEMCLIDDMKALGLPVSFQTNKEWKTRRTRGQQGKRVCLSKSASGETAASKDLSIDKGIKDRSGVVNNDEDKDVASSLEFVSDFSSIPYLMTSDPAIGDEITILEETNHEIVGSCCLENEDRDSMLTSETTDSQSCKLNDDHHESNEWKVYWDSFYGRSYFYNVKTQESTWQPPLGMEHLAYSYETHNLNELAIETTEKPHENLIGTGPVVDVTAEKSEDLLGGVCQSQCELEPLEEDNSLNDTFQETPVGNQPLDTYAIVKSKKKTRRTRAKKILSETRMKGVVEEYSEILGKYWCQRYLLFSRFDQGIKMDEEGWFSVTPEPIAKHHATRCKGGLVIDCFTGVGGNAIQFASRSLYVVAIDLDSKKLDLAKHNAAIYGVADKIDFVKGDFFQLAHNLKGGTVFLSPPWGGPDYVKASIYDLKTMLRPRDGDSLFKAALNIASTIIMFLPRNVDINQLAELALSTSPPWSLEVEKNYLNGRLKAITAYYTLDKHDC